MERQMRVHLFLLSSRDDDQQRFKQFEDLAVANNIFVVQHGPNLTTGEMYDSTQCDELFKDGDLFVCNSGKTVGFLSKAWPVAVFGETGSLHLAAETIWREYPGVREAAKALAGTLEASNEATVKEVNPEYY
jgi:hypothetical protein